MRKYSFRSSLSSHNKPALKCDNVTNYVTGKIDPVASLKSDSKRVQKRLHLKKHAAAL